MAEITAYHKMYHPYQYYENLWNIIKPIRGRSEDVRPIGKRTRDHEAVVRIERDGVVSYGAKLYDTVCVEYFPDDTMIIRCGGWSTPSTAEFISDHGFYCWKQYGKLWVRLREGEQVVPVTSDGVKFVIVHGKWQLAEPLVIKKAVVDKAKAKDAREPLMPFINFVKTFLTLSEGWVMHETCKQALGWVGDSADQYRYATKDTYITERELFDKLMREPNDETYLFALCCFAQVGSVKLTHDSGDRRLAEEFEYDVTFNPQHTWKTTNKFYDVRIHFGRLKQRIYKWVHDYSNVHKTVEVTPTNKAMQNVR